MPNTEQSVASIKELVNEYKKELSEDKKNELFQKIIDELCKLGVDSYSFYITCNKMVQKIESDETIDRLSRYLETKKETLSKAESDEKNKCFTVFYLVAYYYWENKRITDLNNLIKSYIQYFTTFALALQIQGRVSRRNKKYKEAIDYDKKAEELLKEKSITNPAFKYTTAASVANALENGYFNAVSEDDIYRAIKSAEEAINQNPDYHKWYYLKAKLQIYSIVYFYSKGEKDKYNNFEQIIEESIDFLGKAVDRLDSSSRSYDSTKMKYESYRLQGDRIKSEMGLQKQLAEAKESLENMIKKQNEIEQTLHNEQIKYLEILAVFVSVITIIITIMGSTQGKYSVNELSIIIVVMNLSVLAVYSGFLLLVKNGVSIKSIIVGLLCSLIIIRIINPTLFDNMTSWLFNVFRSNSLPDGTPH